MLNISCSLIQYEIFENDQILCSGTIPYDLLHYVRSLTETGSTLRKIRVNIDGDIFVIDSVGYSITAFKDETTTIYQLLTNNQQLEIQNQRDQAALLLLQQQQDAEGSANAARFLQQQAVDAFNQYQEMLVAQKQITAEQAQLAEAEKLRQDENRIALVRGIALDPTTAPAALTSEFGQTGDVRRQIAAVMTANIEISKLVAAVDSKYWISSFEIMAVLGSQSSTDRDLAQIVANQLPDGSNLKQMLTNFGWAN